MSISSPRRVHQATAAIRLLPASSPPIRHVAVSAAGQITEICFQVIDPNGSIAGFGPGRALSFEVWQDTSSMIQSHAFQASTPLPLDFASAVCTTEPPAMLTRSSYASLTFWQRGLDRARFLAAFQQITTDSRFPLPRVHSLIAVTNENACLMLGVWNERTDERTLRERLVPHLPVGLEPPERKKVELLQLRNPPESYSFTAPM